MLGKSSKFTHPPPHPHFSRILFFVLGWFTGCIYVYEPKWSKANRTENFSKPTQTASSRRPNCIMSSMCKNKNFINLHLATRLQSSVSGPHMNYISLYLITHILSSFMHIYIYIYVWIFQCLMGFECMSIWEKWNISIFSTKPHSDTNYTWYYYKDRENFPLAPSHTYTAVPHSYKLG